MVLKANPSTLLANTVLGECFTANFSRKEKTDEPYWQEVNRTATQRYIERPTTLLLPEAYRELNRMTLFAMNVMASMLLNREAEHPIDTKPLENIVNMTNRHLSVRAPHSLSEHDALLKALQSGINDYCDAIGEPSTNFVDFAEKMNALRLSTQSWTPQ